MSDTPAPPRPEQTRGMHVGSDIPGQGVGGMGDVGARIPPILQGEERGDRLPPNPAAPTTSRWDAVADDIPEVLVAPLLRLSLGLSAVQGLVPAPADERIVGMIAEVDALLVETRRIFCEMSSDRPEPAGMASYLQALVDHAATRVLEEPRLTLTGDLTRVPVPVTQHVCAIAREAVLDLVTRTHPTRMSVDLVVDSDHVVLSVHAGDESEPASEVTCRVPLLTQNGGRGSP